MRPQLDNEVWPGEREVRRDAAFHLEAAQAGWFLKDRRAFEATWSAASFERRDPRIRPATEADLPRLVELEERCWPAPLCQKRASLHRRIERDPGGQLVLELDGAVVAAVYSQRIQDAEALLRETMETVERLRCDDGPILQLLAINVLPEMQDRNLGDQLLDFMLQRAALQSDLRKVVGVTRCKDYGKHADVPVEEYIRLRNERGSLIDTTLRFHENHGAEIQRVIPSYRSEDVQNRGAGVLLEYDLRARAPAPAALRVSQPVAHIVRDVVEAKIKELLGPEREGAYAAERPLMEMGLDSGDLLDLNETLSSTFNETLESSFFFEHNTPTRIASFLSRGKAPESAAPPVVLRQVEAEASDARGRGAMPLAVVGMACRLPGGIGAAAALWQALLEGRDCVGTLPPERWRWPAFIDPAGEHAGIDRGGFLDDISRFDPSFFRITPREAELIDPQQRLLLELSWQCLEDAGYAAASLAGSKTGVFIGASGSDHARRLDAREDVDAQYALATAMSLLANRLSYFYDFHGPSLQLDTACSSSLVAVHEAARSMQAGECDLALVGGIHLMLHPALSIAYYKAGMLSKRGRCRTFDAQADGYVRGEGAALVLLKPLVKALEDGDDVYALIRGSAVNHGGLAGGLTAPNPARQSALIVEAYRDAGVDPRSVGYVEAHGTGTALGDPVEIKGLTDAFASLGAVSAGDAPRRCGLGSIKTNLGHLEAAAGLAGLLKAALCLRARTRVASLHCERLNPKIDLRDTGFYVCDRAEAWPLIEGQRSRRASVSSFGSGGANAHVVLEEHVAPPREPRAGARGAEIIVLSARTEPALRRQAERLRGFLSARGGEGAVDITDLAYTLQTGRQALDCRLAFLARSAAEVQEKLAAFLSGHAPAPDVYVGQTKDHRESVALFDGDDDLRTAVEMWIEKRKDHRLMELWVRGLALPWDRLYTDRQVRKVRLPTYPFGGADEGVAEQRPSRASGVYTKRWGPSELPPPTRHRGRVRIITGAATESLARRLAGRLGETQIVELRSPSDTARQEHALSGVIDLVGCAAGDPMDLGWLAPLQELIRAARAGGLRLLAVSRGLEGGEGQRGSPAGATRASLHRMLGAEYGFLRAQHLDLDAGGDDDRDAATIAAEFLADSTDAAVRYRAGVRQTPRLQAVAAGPVEAHPRTLPADAALVVTGGTRGLGWLCARHLVEKHGVRRVVLTGREPLPPRDRWHVLAREDSALGRKLQRFLKLDQLGAEVVALAMDLTDPREVERLVASQGKIGGVVHAAGRADWETLAFVTKSVDGVRAILEPKIQGVIHLYEAVKDQPLSFFVLFSSVAAALPTLAAGQSDYSMANAYLDAFAMSRRAPFPLVSVQWPSWKESGMGEVSTRAYRDTGLLSCTDAEGLELLDRILAGGDEAVLLPAVFDPAVWRPEALLQPRPPAPGGSVTQVAAAAGPAAPEPRAGQETVQKTERWLLDVFAEELKIDRAQLEADTEFQDYGVDSILLAQVLTRINKELDDDLSPSLIFEYPTIRALACVLAGRHAPSEARPPASARVEAVSPVPERPSPQRSGDAIAVIGLSCRFAGAPDVEQYWRLLQEGRSGIRAVPEARWGRKTPYFAGLLDAGPSCPPADLLLTEEDARAMDPQALLLLEESASLLRHAGYAAEALKGSATGVYLGARSDHQAPARLLERMRNPILAFGQNYLAANVSHLWDFQGPSLVVDTACSSALVALKLAALALQAGEIEQAVVGGITLLSDDRYHQLFARRGILSPDRHFHLFDRRAHGVVLGEGVGLVLIKRLERALRDGDAIHALVRAVECNNDGRTAGPATPSIKAQRAVMERALERSGVRPLDVGYIEMNGTGSEVTDLIELKATEAVYQRPQATEACALGSMKPNVGHTLCAEGVASLIKVALMLEHGTMVPFLSGTEPMRHHEVSAGGFYFCREAEAWRAAKRIAALSCFADGGTNVHAILEAWRESRSAASVRRPLSPPAPGHGAAVVAREEPRRFRNRWKQDGGQSHG